MNGKEDLNSAASNSQQVRSVSFASPIGEIKRMTFWKVASIIHKAASGAETKIY